MSFTGKATYTAGVTLPELAEDMSDLVGIISPYETPLLDALGDPRSEAASTQHEWLEDELLPNKDEIEQCADTVLEVAHGDRFRIADQIQVEGSEELMLVTEVAGNILLVVREYAGTKRGSALHGQTINILGNAALEGAEKPNVRFTQRVRCNNQTQVFTGTVEVNGSDMKAGQLGLADEMDYQKQERLRELVRDLERAVISGGLPIPNPSNWPDARKMTGILSFLQTNVTQAEGKELDEPQVNAMLRRIWENSNGNIDLIVVGEFQRRKVNAFCSDSRSYGATDTTFTDMVSIYESDFGVCRIVTSRWLPQDAVLFLDSSRISVLSLAGRSFHFKTLATAGDYEAGEIIGEYTLELKNESAHGVIRGLATT